MTFAEILAKVKTAIAKLEVVGGTAESDISEIIVILQDIVEAIDLFAKAEEIVAGLA